ncbi:MAG: aldo/keto reductase [Acholeplasmataceae bacterium]|nr:aldo/keto reductase [Acholeplasmataceae bacterium]
MNKYFTLANGVEIPVIGFGTWQIPDGGIAYNSVLEALKAGYRHIDTAMVYGNEKSVGRAIKDSGVKREDIFVTTKLSANIKGYEEALAEFEKSMHNLQLDYLDLYLIHNVKPWSVASDGYEYMEKNIASWKAFEKLYKEGKIRAIGVSNFLPGHLEILIKNTEIAPMVNQIRLNPQVIPTDNIKYCRENNILIEAYSPFATGRIFSDDKYEAIAAKYNKSVAQLLVRWSLQYGFLPLPKSVTATRIKENLDVFDFEITPEDMKAIGNIK